MNDNEQGNGSSGGIGLAGLLCVLFVALKLTHHIDWAWVWVLSPLWIGLAFGLVVLIVALPLILWLKR